MQRVNAEDVCDGWIRWMNAENECGLFRLSSRNKRVTVGWFCRPRALTLRSTLLPCMTNANSKSHMAYGI